MNFGAKICICVILLTSLLHNTDCDEAPKNSEPTKAPKTFKLLFAVNRVPIKLRPLRYTTVNLEY